MTQHHKRKIFRKPLIQKIKIENFGPVSKGEIQLKPLTVFIGPNNSGKSYIAELIYATYKAHEPRLKNAIDSVLGKILFQELPPHLGVSEKLKGKDGIRNEVREILKDLEKERKVTIPKDLIERVQKEIIYAIYSDRLSEELKRIFAIKSLSQLIRVKARKSSIEITHNTHIRLEISGGRSRKAQVLGFNPNNVKITVQLDNTLPEYEIGTVLRENSDNTAKKYRVKINSKLLNKKHQKQKKVPHFLRNPKKFIENFIIDILAEICSKELLGPRIQKCYYLPAARSGILEGHRTLIASTINFVQYPGNQPIELVRFPGTIADFISQIVTIDQNSKTGLQKFAEKFERELIKGTIKFKTPYKKTLQEILYSSGTLKIPLHRASSAVSELAPLFLYIKHVIKPNDMLIIEEPEAHLHPKNQRILAELLAALVRQGIYVMIITHSDFIIGQINNFIKLGTLSEAERKNSGYSPETYLKPEEVAAYLFKQDSPDSYSIERLKITPTDGIPQEPFTEVVNALYEETYWLEETIEKSSR